jgi:hypothetical protein
MPDEADERHAASRHGAPHTNSNPEGETVEQRVSRMQLREYAVERRLKELKDRVVARMLRRLERIEAAHTRDAAQHALTRISTLAEELKVKSSQALEDRIKELEAGLKGSVMATITQRLVAIESQLTGTLCSLLWCACSLPPSPRACSAGCAPTDDSPLPRRAWAACTRARALLPQARSKISAATCPATRAPARWRASRRWRSAYHRSSPSMRTPGWEAPWHKQRTTSRSMSATSPRQRNRSGMRRPASMARRLVAWPAPSPAVGSWLS